MKTEIKADILIYNDKTIDLDETKRFVADSDYLPETKAYYNKLIRIKRAMNLMDKGELFLFTEYFDTKFSISEMIHFYCLDKYALPSAKSDLIKILAIASFKFLVYTTIDPSFAPKDMDALILDTAVAMRYVKRSEYPKHVDAFDNFFAVDTYKHNVLDIIDKAKDYSRYFEYVCNLVDDYTNLSARAIREINPFLKNLTNQKPN